MTRSFSTSGDARRLAYFAHTGQVDKAGASYFSHVSRVADAVEDAGGSEVAVTAALLHDVIEDTVITAKMLLDLGFSAEVVRLVRLLTRDDVVSHTVGGSDEYYRGIRNSPDATLIKLMDIEDNTLEWRLAELEPRVRERLERKYAYARKALLG